MGRLSWFLISKARTKKHFLTSLLQRHRWMWSPSHQTRMDGRWKIMGRKVLNRKKPHRSVFFLNVYKRPGKPLNSARDGAKIWRSDPLSISHDTMDLCCVAGQPECVWDRLPRIVEQWSSEDLSGNGLHGQSAVLILKTFWAWVHFSRPKWWNGRLGVSEEFEFGNHGTLLQWLHERWNHHNYL